MAHTLNAENVAAAEKPPLNSAARITEIREIHGLMVDLKAQRKAISKQITDLGNKRIKPLMTIKEWAIAVKVVEAFAVAEEAEGDGVGKLEGNLKDMFEALAKGQQLDWVTAMAKTAAGAEDDGFATAAQDAAEIAGAFEAGRVLGAQGMKLPDARQAWAGDATKPKRVTRAFDDGWSQGFTTEQKAQSDAPRRGRKSNAQKETERLAAERKAAEPRQRPGVASPEEARRVAAECVAEAAGVPSVAPASAYNSGYNARSQGVDFDAALAEYADGNTLDEQRDLAFRLGWDDRGEEINNAVEGEPVEEPVDDEDAALARQLASDE